MKFESTSKSTDAATCKLYLSISSTTGRRLPVPMMSDSMSPPNPIPTRTSSIGPANGTTNGGHRNYALKIVPASGAQRPRKPGHERTMSTAVDGAGFGGGGWSPEKEGILLGPYDYMVQQPGKDIRKQLISAFNRWLQVPEESLAVVTRIVVMLHTASLL